jgi:hypothetical protein
VVVFMMVCLCRHGMIVVRRWRQRPLFENVMHPMGRRVEDEKEKYGGKSAASAAMFVNG